MSLGGGGGGGRCRFVESLKGIMLNVFIEHERIRLCIFIVVEQQCVYSLKIFIRFSVAYEKCPFIFRCLKRIFYNLYQLLPIILTVNH